LIAIISAGEERRQRISSDVSTAPALLLPLQEEKVGMRGRLRE
jgi:hypothetical protein